jgi:ketosteroid isomerase-like protein
MSIPSGNVATVRRALSAYASGDLPSFFAELDSDIEWIGAREFPDARAFRGHDGVRDALRLWSDVWDTMELRASEFLAADDGRVLAVGEVQLHAEETGLDFTSPMAMLIAVRRGKLAFVQFFLDLDEARAAAALT